MKIKGCGAAFTSLRARGGFMGFRGGVGDLEG